MSINNKLRQLTHAAACVLICHSSSKTRVSSTKPMVQSPWEAVGCITCQKVPCLYGTWACSQLKPIHTLKSCFFDIHCKMILNICLHHLDLFCFCSWKCICIYNVSLIYRTILWNLLFSYQTQIAESITHNLVTQSAIAKWHKLQLWNDWQTGQQILLNLTK